MAKQKRIHQMTIPQFEAMFPNEDACCAYLVGQRWPEGVHCPRCGAVKVYRLAMPWHWQCTACAPGGSTGYRFSHITGTIFENTNKPLREWFRVIHMMLTSKKGVSSLQVQRVMGFGSYRTALYMCNRIRAGLANEDFNKLMGIVEIDETYIGGKDSNRHGPHDGSGGRGRSTKRKTVVVGAVERKGNVVARVIARADGHTIGRFINETISTKVSLLAHDDWKAYQYLAMHPNFRDADGTVVHSKKQYVVGAIHTNTIEGFWSLVKRGIVGSYHKVSRKYLPLYIAEFQFRYNNRHNEDIFGTAISGC